MSISPADPKPTELTNEEKARLWERMLHEDNLFQERFNHFVAVVEGSGMVLGTEEIAIQQAHRNMVSSSIADMARLLQELLSRRLTAYVAGVKDGKSVARWASGETDIRHESEQRLRTAYEIAQLLASFDSPRIVRGWFVGPSPQLQDTSPAQAIHDGRLQDALAAARAFIVGG